ncbi:hypothetical protein CDL12_28062 [Handroanthus impetiginosus]|uniref:Uncharacterized protein n=1 Tax=Handroanthus impetiginosus TaxID=429701 RepID=A0A2G9G2A6_9LAMI|nr:hypothetical protein CDL12_28062 [Handroanthus impetiginosus]
MCVLSCFIGIPNSVNFLHCCGAHWLEMKGMVPIEFVH